MSARPGTAETAGNRRAAETEAVALGALIAVAVAALFLASIGGDRTGRFDAPAGFPVHTDTSQTKAAVAIPRSVPAPTTLRVAGSGVAHAEQRQADRAALPPNHPPRQTTGSNEQK
jgi:hypothetical protein